MNKVQTSLVSLVAAVPGGLLAYSMVMSFLNYASQSPLSFRIISGVTLVTAVLLALLPLAILAYGGPRKAKAAAAAAAATGPLAVSAPLSVVDASEVESIDDLEVAGETNDADFEMGESFDDFQTDSEVTAVAEDDFEVEAMDTFDGVPVEEVPADDFDLAGMESFDGPIDEIPMEDFEEEPPAKKKKKK